MKSRNSEERAAPFALVLLVSLAWIPVGVVAAVQGHLFQVYSDGTEARSLWSWLLFQGPRWVPWVLLTPVVYWLVRRFPLGPDRPWRGAAIHAVTGSIVVLVHSTISAVLYQSGYPETFGAEPFLEVLTLQASVWLVIAYVVYWGLVGGWTVLEYHGRLRDEALEAARLQSQLASARLESLEARLQPHFLLNTLQAVSTLLTRDPGRARSMLRRLGELLRTTLDRSRGHRVTLREELRIVRAYLEIEQVRLGERLRVEWKVDDQVGEVLVPNLLIQPLVENAIKHGVATRSDPGTVLIQARCADGRFSLTVEDRAGSGTGDRDLPGRDDPEIDGARHGNGLGLKSVRERLAVLYGDEASVELQPTGLGTRARVILPCAEPAGAHRS